MVAAATSSSSTRGPSTRSIWARSDPNTTRDGLAASWQRAPFIKGEGWRRGSPPGNERSAHFTWTSSTHVLATYTYTYTSQGSFPRAVENRRYSSVVFQSFSTSIFFPKMEIYSSIFGKSTLASAHAGYRHGHC